MKNIYKLLAVSYEVSYDISSKFFKNLSDITYKLGLISNFITVSSLFFLKFNSCNSSL